jgi:hypothetical protein
MAAVGDRVQVPSKRVGQTPREGVVTGVSGVLLRVTWSGGEESTIFPSMGSVVVVGRVRAAKKGVAKETTRPVKKPTTVPAKKSGKPTTKKVAKKSAKSATKKVAKKSAKSATKKVAKKSGKPQRPRATKSLPKRSGRANKRRK